MHPDSVAEDYSGPSPTSESVNVFTPAMVERMLAIESHITSLPGYEHVCWIDDLAPGACAPLLPAAR